MTFFLIPRLETIIMTSAIEDTKEETNSYVYSHNHLDETHFSSSFMVFAQLRNEDVLTDITLKAGDDEGLQVTAHKLVLMAASEYFRTMFKACFSEANTDTLCLHGMMESLRENAYKSVPAIVFYLFAYLSRSGIRILGRIGRLLLYGRDHCYKRERDWPLGGCLPPSVA